MVTIRSFNFLLMAKSLVLPPVAIDSYPEEPIMKSTFVISLVLSLLASSAFALPSNNPPPLLGEVKDSQQETLPQDRHVAEGGAERLLEQRHNG
jgi:hypothetical protein